jgi:hypothetical protein
MPTVIPAGYAQLTHRFSPVSNFGSAPAVVYGVDATLTIDVAAACHQAFHDFWSQVGSDDVLLASTQLKYGPNDTGPMYEHEELLAGGLSGPIDSPSVSILIQKRSALGGRSNRGRMYLPGIEAGLVGPDGGLSGTAVSVGQAAADAFLADIDAAIGPMVILHSDLSAPTPVTDLVLQTWAATQRRRLRA